jgi:hypothetical protein
MTPCHKGSKKKSKSKKKKISPSAKSTIVLHVGEFDEVFFQLLKNP